MQNSKAARGPWDPLIWDTLFMKIKNLMLAALLLVGIGAQAQMETSIPVDKDVRIGKLSNGLTYYIRHNNWPEKKKKKHKK